MRGAASQLLGRRLRRAAKWPGRRHFSPYVKPKRSGVAAVIGAAAALVGAAIVRAATNTGDAHDGNAGGTITIKAPPTAAPIDVIEAARKVNRRKGFPALEPYRTGMLDVPDSLLSGETVATGGATHHRLYYEECGNPKGKPVVMVHGGPAGGCSSFDRQQHDPSVYRIICFDQRGCGRSSPVGCLEVGRFPMAPIVCARAWMCVSP